MGAVNSLFSFRTHVKTSPSMIHSSEYVFLERTSSDRFHCFNYLSITLGAAFHTGLEMKNRRMIYAVVLIVVVVLLGVFLLVGVPLIQQTFTPPITGIPATSAGNSLRDRYTQTALAKSSSSGASASATP